MKDIVKFRDPDKPGYWCLPDSTVRQIEYRLLGLEEMTKKVTYCRDCGSIWYDAGWTAECPNCRIRELKDEETILRKRLEKMEEVLRDILDNVTIIHLDANGDHRYALNHRAHRAITRATALLAKEGGGDGH